MSVQFFGGDEGTRTPDLCVANASLYHLSHAPIASALYHRAKNYASVFTGNCDKTLTVRKEESKTSLDGGEYYFRPTCLN